MNKIVVSEHDYEPIAISPPAVRIAPVVRITDTDVVHVADSDESYDDRARGFPVRLSDGDIVVPLDGRLEDVAMAARELGEAAELSEEHETAQQMQDRIEERFLSAGGGGGLEPKIVSQLNANQVNMRIFCFAFVIMCGLIDDAIICLVDNRFISI